MLVDSHVNLHGERYAEDLPDVLDRARDAGVGQMLLISDRLDNCDEIAEIASAPPEGMRFWRSVGVHPHHAKDYRTLSAETLIELAGPENVVGIGECGLDLHYEYSDLADQKPVFEAHINASIATGLPLIIHARNADDHVEEMLVAGQGRGAFTPLLHCYTGKLPLAKAALEMGGYVAFSGILTFKRADDVRAVAAEIPLERIIIETDCPFLAPVPHRGRRNEPAYLTHVADALAELKGVRRAEVDRVTTENFFTLFRRAQSL